MTDRELFGEQESSVPVVDGYRELVDRIYSAHVLGVGDRGLAQRPEAGLDRAGPGGAGRGEAQFDLVLPGPGADGLDRSAVGTGCADGFERSEERRVGKGCGAACARCGG